jgi:catechol 2,3-dioxygenase
MTPARSIHPATRIGHVHLKVADLERALGFYRDVLGFEVTQRMGTEAVFLSAGGYHHHIGLNTWESRGGSAARISSGLKRCSLMAVRSTRQRTRTRGDPSWPGCR